jgi:hypothetical protein
MCRYELLFRKFERYVYSIRPYKHYELYEIKNPFNLIKNHESEYSNLVNKYKRIKYMRYEFDYLEHIENYYSFYDPKRRNIILNNKLEHMESFIQVLNELLKKVNYYDILFYNINCDIIFHANKFIEDKLKNKHLILQNLETNEIRQRKNKIRKEKYKLKYNIV